VYGLVVPCSLLRSFTGCISNLESLETVGALPDMVPVVPVKRVHVFVSGEVQGVFFRVECARRARSLGLGGFVRNTPDGRVEAVFEGGVDAVDRMVAWCREGPELASVASIDLSEEAPVDEREFRISH
jgi:acylphosphatase